jgi:uncharacterized protein
MALHKTEQFFANLVKDYLDKTTDKAVKDHVVCNRGGLQMLEPSMKALFDESAAAYKAEQLAALEREMARVQRNCATGKKELEAKLTRRAVLAQNGHYIAQAYAEKVGIPLDKATAELNEYAARKTDHFNAGNLADEYAALKHLPNLTGPDRTLAHEVSKREAAKIQTPEEAEDMEVYNRIEGKTTSEMIKQYSGRDFAYWEIYKNAKQGFFPTQATPDQAEPQGQTDDQWDEPI